MIVPGKRLLWLLALAGLPAVVVASVFSGPESDIAWAIPALLLLVAMADAAGCLGRLNGIEAKEGDSIRLSKDREGPVEVRVLNHGAPIGVRFGLAFPATFETPEPILAMDLAASKKVAILPFVCTARQRGPYAFERLYLEADSWLGLWCVRASRPLKLEVRVFPDLRRDRAAAAIFLNRGMDGIHVQRQVGKGREFEKLREYMPGDSFEDIHWKSTAKRGRPITMTYQIERTQEVYAIVDASRLSARRAGTDRDPFAPTLLERYVNAAMLLGAAAERQGDRFGLVTFAGAVRHYVPSGTGKAHHDACRNAVYGLRAEETSPDFDALCVFLRNTLRKRALLIFLTALDDSMIAESFLRSTRLIHRTHLCYCVMTDPQDAQPLFAKAAPGTAGIYDALAAHDRWEHLSALTSNLAVLGVRMRVTTSERYVLSMLEHYMEVKKRQLL